MKSVWHEACEDTDTLSDTEWRPAALAYSERGAAPNRYRAGNLGQRLTSMDSGGASAFKAGGHIGPPSSAGRTDDLGVHLNCEPRQSPTLARVVLFVSLYQGADELRQAATCRRQLLIAKVTFLKWPFAIPASKHV